ncbi:MAG: PAS domain S-box protein, partial [Bacteroidetes bacterium]
MSNKPGRECVHRGIMNASIARTLFKYSYTESLLFILFVCLIYSQSLNQYGAQSVSLQTKDYNFDEDWRWVHFTTESGLQKSPGFQLIETEDGTTWLSHHWFDGFQWWEAEDWTISHLWFNAVVGGLYENVLVGLHEYRYLYRIQKEGISKLFTPGFKLTHFIVVAPDSLLLLNEEGSLFLYAHGKIQPYPFSQGRSDNRVVGLARAANGSVFVSALDGLYRLKAREWKRMIPSLSKNLIFSNNVHSFASENNNGKGCTYISLPYEQQGLWTWDNNSEARRIGGPFELARVIAYDISPSDEIITAHDNGEVRLWSGSSWQRLPSIESRFNDIFLIQFRSNGDLWIGADNGLHLYRRSIKRWSYIAEQGDAPENFIHEILSTRDSSLWLATREGVTIIKPDGTRQRVTRIGNTALRTITGLGEDNDGNIWISSGAMFDGAYRWNKQRWEYFPIFNSPYGNLIHKIRKDRAGRLWFLGLGNAMSLAGNLQPGAFLYDNGTFERWDVQKGLLNGRVYDFAEGPDGSYWFAMKDGISRWKGGKWKHWTSENGLNRNVPSVYCIIVGEDGTAWFGHDKEGGLGTIDSTGAVHYFTTYDGLVHQGVRDLHFDDENKLWISTQNGISCYSNGTFITYDERSGLTTPHTWPILVEKNKILVGTLGGGVGILDQEQPRSPLPQITIETPSLVGEFIIFNWQPFAYWNEIPPAEMLTRYRVDEGVWSKWSKERSVQFYEMEPGEYTFTVQAKGLFGEYDEQGAATLFTIPPPLYLRPIVFYPMLALSLGAITLIGVLLWRKRAYDLSLKESEAKFRSVSTTTASAIFIFLENKFMYLNPAAEKLTGYSLDELYSKVFLDLLHRESLNEVQAFLHDWLQ